VAAGLVLALLTACSPGTGEQPAPDQAGAGEASFTEATYVTPIGDLAPAEQGAGERLRIVATTNLVGDALRRVGGEAIDLTVMLPYGADPHGYVATPRELAAAADSDLVFVSGFGFEEGIRAILEQVAADVPVVSISEGVAGIPLPEGAEEHEHEGEAAGTGEPGATAEEHHGGTDPHVWFDPTIVMHWTRNAAAALSALDPADQETFQSNADAYVQDLQELDGWIKESVAAIPESQRVLVTDHYVFGYFARRYGFQVVGAVIPAYSTSASPSPQEMADLLSAIEVHQVKAVFVGLSASAVVAEAVSADIGIPVVSLYTESLGEPGSPADTYLTMMEYNVNAIVEALR
jgi:ABC-type Zn uptake system ZnuABC Zn-binding protein ZnuA